MQFDIKKYLPQILIVVGFIAFAFINCYPQLQGKVLFQGDIQNWRGMAKEGMDWHEKTGENVLWSNTQFGGMPTYTFYVPKTNNYINQIHEKTVSLLGKPASLFFIAMLCFYMLMRALKTDRWLAVTGAIAYAFTSFNIDSIIAGHDTKIFALGYLPGVLAGLLYIYRGDWWRGIPLLAILLSLMISTEHYQILYYAVIIILFIVICLFIQALKEKNIKQFIIASAISASIAALAFGLGSQLIMATMEYNKTTMRGGQSELTIVGHDTNKKSGGLDKEYAFRWSNSVGETFCILVPYLYGGGNNMPLDDAPKFAEVTGGQTNSAPLYWGPQPFLGASSYFGAIICFLFVFGVMIVRNPLKWWLVALAGLSLLMAMGRHFPEFNYFLFDTLPMYNKFRTPTMSMSIAQLMFPVLAIMGLNELFTGNQDKQALLKKLIIAAGITAGLCLLFAFAGSAFFSFTGGTDNQLPENMRDQLVSALKEDRQSLATKSALISAVYILLAAGLIWAYLKGKMQNVKMVIGGIALLVIIDIMSVAHKFLTDDNYVEKEQQEEGLQPRQVDQQIMQDKDPYYRVLDLSRNIFNDATQAYFHKCIGGYSPTKMEQYQDMIDVHMSRGFNSQVMNMLNTKYIIFDAGNGNPVASANPDACGNAWFVDEVKWVNSADSEILSLNAGRLGDTAKVVGGFEPKHTAVMRNTFQNEMNGYSFGKDSSSTIKLTKYGLNDLAFESDNSKNGLAIFSDMYYPYGWKAYVDDKETPIMKANYILRAIKVPAGKHKITFVFHPDSFYTGDKIALACCLLLIGLSGFSIIQLFKGKAKEA
ncbi:MAG: YfhO family protein [Bacteroidetes bacterium]|nr:YfhO family protein [Bacteroidota bacterium]